MDNNELMKEAFVEATKEVAKDAYDDTLKPSAKNVGGFLGAITGFFNHVVVYPLKKLNIEYEQKALAFEREMQEKYNNIPEQNRVEPELHIVGPAMESLKYNIMQDDLSELFSNLLVSDLDSSTQKLCNPAFIKTLEQLSPNDAKVYKCLYNYCCNGKALAVCTGYIADERDNSNRIQTPILPSYIVDFEIFKMDYLLVSKSLQNLKRVGLVDVDFLHSFTKPETYNNLINQSFIVDLVMAFTPALGISFKCRLDSKGIIILNDYSKDFAKVCLREQNNAKDEK